MHFLIVDKKYFKDEVSFRASSPEGIFSTKALIDDFLIDDFVVASILKRDFEHKRFN